MSVKPGCSVSEVVDGVVIVVGLLQKARIAIGTGRLFKDFVLVGTLIL